MMLPIVISVSVAPVSYFFWASALPEVAAKAMTAVKNAAILGCCIESIVSPWFIFELQDGLSPCETHRIASVLIDGFRKGSTHPAGSMQVSCEPGRQWWRAC